MEDLRREIEDFIVAFAESEDKLRLWRRPLVKFGDARRAEMQKIRFITHPAHAAPGDVLRGAATVICYFFPFRQEIAESNREGEFSSPAWSEAYHTTNAYFRVLNERLIAFLAEKGICAAVSPDAFAFDEERCQSRWSQKSFAYLCGMGSFGVQHQLITEEGCCGRLGTVLMEAGLPVYDTPVGEEYCLYKRNGSCGVCVQRCPVAALTVESYDVFKCKDRCMENEKLYPGDAICGKCAVGVPCSFRKP